MSNSIAVDFSQIYGCWMISSELTYKISLYECLSILCKYFYYVMFSLASKIDDTDISCHGRIDVHV